MEFNKANVARWMRNNEYDCIPDNEAEVDATLLAENAAAAFDQNHEGGPLDDDTHWIWDVALLVAEDLNTEY